MNDTPTTPLEINDEGTRALLEQLPGLVGALDTAIKDTAGRPMAFMLLVFDEGVALHATNTDPTVAHLATKAYIESMERHAAADDATDRVVN